MDLLMGDVISDGHYMPDSYGITAQNLYSLWCFKNIISHGWNGLRICH